MEIFISHITEERNIALKLKGWFESTFLDVDVFVSSDSDDIKAGEKWLREIENGLLDSKVLIVICSPNSLTKPWIYFEAGAGWIKEIPVIPICHSGINKSNLAQPLSNFQALDIDDEDFSRILMNNVANHLGYERKPRINFEQMQIEVLNQIEDFDEEELGLYDHFVVFEEGFKNLTRLINKIGDETNSIREKTNIFRDKFERIQKTPNKKESTAIYQQKLIKSFSEDISSYSDQIEEVNKEYSEELNKVTDSVEYILKNVAVNDEEDRIEVEKFLSEIVNLKESTVEARSSFFNLAETLNDIQNLQKNLNQATEKASKELFIFVDLINETTDMTIKVEILVDDLLGEATID